METYVPSLDARPIATEIDPAFVGPLEDTAPGISTIIAGQRTTNEPWYEALARLLPVLSSTVAQKQLLQVQIDRARAGQQPLEVVADQQRAMMAQSNMVWIGMGILAAIFLLRRR